MTLHTPKTAWALALGNGRVAIVRHAGGEAPQRFAASLAVDPLAGDSQLAAQELREHLQALGRPRGAAVVCLPLDRLMLASVTIPELPPEEIGGFLRLQAEREFLQAPEELALAVSRAELAGPQRLALLAGLPLTQYRNLLRVMTLVGFKQVSVTVGPGELAEVSGTAVRGLLAADAEGLDLAVSAGGGLVVLRRLAGAARAAGATGEAELPAWPVELRISLSRLPAESRQALEELPLWAAPELARRLGEELAASRIPKLPRVAPAPLPGDGQNLLLAWAEAAAQRLAAERPALLALTPAVAVARGAWLAFWGRRRLGWAAGIAAALVLLLLGLVGVQQVQLVQRRAEWAALAPRVEAVRGTIATAKAQHAWFSERPENLGVLRAVTLAFPEVGTVWATRLEIKDASQVTVAGKASDRAAWLRMQDALRQTPGVRNLRVSQARDSGDARAPLTFALSFTWQAAAAQSSTTEKK